MLLHRPRGTECDLPALPLLRAPPDADLDDVDTAAAVHGDIVGIDHLAVLIPEAPEGRDDGASGIDLQDTRSIRRHRGLIAAVYHERLPAAAKGDAPGPAEIGALPDALEVAFFIEDLDPRVASVGDIDVAIRAKRDAVRDAELPGRAP